MTTTSIAPTRNERTEPTMRPALWLAFGLGLIGLALSSYALLTTSALQIQELAGFVGLGVSLLTPPIIALVAARLVAGDLKLSAEIRPIHAYVWRVLRKTRYLLTIDIALMPVTVIMWMAISIAIPAIFANLAPCYEGYNCNVPAPYLLRSVLSQTIGFLIFLLGLWGMCLLLPTISAWFTCLTRSALVGTLGAWIGAALLIYVLGWGVIPADRGDPITWIGFASLPYLLTALIFRLAQPGPLRRR